MIFLRIRGECAPNFISLSCLLIYDRGVTGHDEGRNVSNNASGSKGDEKLVEVRIVVT